MNARYATLLAYLLGEDDPASDPVPADVEKLRILVGELVASRSWHTSAPAFVDQTDKYQDRTVGIALRYAVDASGAPLNRALDRLYLEDVLSFVKSLQWVNADMVGEIDLNLDDDYVGCIYKGAQDGDLRTWLAAWQARTA